MSETIMIVITGILIVFFVLILLTLFIVLIGKSIAASEMAAIRRKNKKANLQAQVSAEPQDVQVPPVAFTKQVSDAVENDDNELVAAISAAIAMIYQSEGNANPFTIKSIRRVTEGRPIWAAAGIAEATTPF